MRIPGDDIPDSPNRFRGFVWVFLAVTALGLGAIAAFNLWVDPGGRFRGSHRAEDATAELLLSGQGVVRDITMDESYLNARIALEKTPLPQAIALGSSRVGEVTADLMPVAPFYNHAVGSALMDYHIGLMSAYQARGALPRLVLFEVDPWIFSVWPNRDTSSLAVFQPGLNAVARQAGIDLSLLAHRPPTRRWQVFSLAVARTSWGALTDNAAGACSVRPLNEDTEPCYGIRADGSHRGSTQQMAQTPATVEAVIQRDMSAVDRRARIREGLDFIEADPQRLQAFANLLEWLRQRDVRVVLMLSPFHPLAEQWLRRDPPRSESAWSRFEEVENQVRAIAQRQDVAVLGSYEAARAGCAAEEFVDWLHPRRSCVIRILTPLKGN